MQNTCPKCAKPTEPGQITCPECGTLLTASWGDPAKSSVESFVGRYGREDPAGRHSWWSRQSKRAKISMIGGTVAVLALLVIITFWGSLFESGNVRSLNVSQDKQDVTLHLDSLEYISSPRDSSKVIATLVVWGDYDFRVRATVIQGSNRCEMVELQTISGMRWTGSVYFDHFDIAKASKIEVSLGMGDTSREFVFEIPDR